MLRLRRQLAACLALPLAAGCASPEGREGADFRVSPEGLESHRLFIAPDAIDRDWLHFQVWRETDWQLTSLDGEVVIRAEGRGSSSGLGRWVEVDTADCPVAEWSWRVDALPDSADLGIGDKEDVAASIFFAFGDPGSMSLPRPVPTLRYAWSTAANPEDAVIDSPFFPGTLKTVVVQSGETALGRWVDERRDLRADYLSAFGELPPEPVQVFALFTDNDHLEEPTVAYYRWAHMRCTDLPDTGLL